MAYSGPNDPALPAHVLGFTAKRRGLWFAAYERSVAAGAEEPDTAADTEIEAMDMDPGDVHEDAPIPGVSVGPGRLILSGVTYYKKMVARLKKHVHPDVYKQAHAHAAGHASGVARKEKKAAGEGDEPHDLADLLAYTDAEDPEERLVLELPAGFAEKSDPPEWIPLLPRPGSYTHGRYGKVVISRERNQRFADHLNNGVYSKLHAIDAEHELKWSGPLGFFDGARLNGDGSVDAHVAEWNDRGQTLWRRYKYVSPEWWDQWVDPATNQEFKDVVVGLALVRRPFFKDNAGGTWLRGLAASDDGSLTTFEPSEAEEGATEEPLAATDDEADDTDPSEEESMRVRFHEADKGGGSGGGEAPVTLSQFNELRTLLEAATTTTTKLAADLEAERGKREAAEKLLNETTAEVVAGRISARRQRFSEEVRGLVGENEGRPWVGDVATHVQMMEFIVQHDEKGDESELLKSYREQQRAVAEIALVTANGERPLGAQLGTGRAVVANSATAKADELTKARVAADTTGKLTYEQAMTAVFDENRSLYDQVNAEAAAANPRRGG